MVELLAFDEILGGVTLGAGLGLEFRTELALMNVFVAIHTESLIRRAEMVLGLSLNLMAILAGRARMLPGQFKSGLLGVIKGNILLE